MRYYLVYFLPFEVKDVRSKEVSCLAKFIHVNNDKRCCVLAASY